jgi:nickel/cobalt transporter (NiCoT) family protein
MVGMASVPVVRAFDRGERRRLGGLLSAVAVLHILGWGGMLVFVAPRYPAMLGLAALAYTFGLRHAFDADHIAAIDNSTRKLLQDGRKPMGVGFFFSLGHSSVVLLITLGLGLAVRWIVTGVDHGQLSNAGGIIGTSVSGAFLLLIGLLNLAVLLDILGVYSRMKRGECSRAELEHQVVAGGLFTRLFSRLFKLVGSSWQLYPIGFLFGLGFDTASEVALLAISAAAVAKGLPFVGVLTLPVIFAAGMSLMDTLDGAFMSKAYAWAFSNPVRKVFYNLTVTGLSVFVALFVGLVEVAQIAIKQLGLMGGVWDAIRGLDFSTIGFIIVAAFVVTWVAAFAIFKVRRVEERWGAFLEAA